MSRTTVLVCLLALVSPALAQIEPNTPNGTLLVNTQSPPATVVRRVSSDLQMDVSSTTLSAPYALLFGTHGALPVGSQFLNVDIRQPVIAITDGIGLGLGPVVFPADPGVLVGGQASFTFPPFSIPPHVAGTLQAGLLSAAAPGGLELTGAMRLRVVPDRLDDEFSGDDEVRSYDLLGSMYLFGQTYHRVSVSSNGWVKFGADASNSQYAETTASFLNGSVGAAPAGSGPVIAALWDDLDMGNRPDQRVRVFEDGVGGLTVRWENADYYPNLFLGTIDLLIDTQRGIVRVNYQLDPGAPTPTDGLVGISDGGTTGTAVPVEHNLSVVPGSRNGYTPTNASESLFQNFGAGPLSEPFDLSAVFLTFRFFSTNTYSI